MPFNQLNEKLGREIGSKEARHSEGNITKTIEKETAKVPSGVYLGLAMGSIFTSMALQALGKKSSANFIGLWVPTILILGLYNKMVKLEGSEPTGAKNGRSDPF